MSTSNYIPYSLVLIIDVSEEYKTDINNVFQLIQTPSFSDYQFIITHISIEDKEERNQYYTKPTSPIFIDDYYESTASIFKTQFIAKLHDSDLTSITSNSHLISQDLNYCNHIATKGILFKYPNNLSSNEDFILCSLLKTFLHSNPDRNMLVEVDYSKEELTTWQKVYHEFEYSDNMSIVLNIKGDLPDDKSVLDKFTSSNITFAIVPISLFLTNKNGFPVLSKLHQELLKKLFLFKVGVILRDDTNMLQKSKDMNVFGDYRIYIDHLFQGHKQFNRIDYLTNNYHDVLQIPLQPLKDNLQSQTYEAFEDDEVKYLQYQYAIYEAMNDLLKDNKQRVLTIGVFGGGRGPLVRKAIQAWNDIRNNYKEINEKQAEFICVEKNSNVFNTLLSLKINEKELFGNVEMIFGDMRSFVLNNNSMIDICISELLGSFGDNELSPECLFNLQKHMSQDGIMIPQKYTSFLRPVYCPKIWANIKTIKESYHSPYVILFNRAYYPIEKVEKCFEFNHPIQNSQLNQFSSLKFTFEEENDINGFAGYFSSVLYKNILLSIEPSSHTPDLFSWFPIYFPSIVPIHMNKGEVLVINIKRENNGHKVWYEWNFDKGNSNTNEKQIHNNNGVNYSMIL